MTETVNSNETKELSMENIYNSFLQNLKSIEIFFNKLMPIAENEDKAIEEGKNEMVNSALKSAFGEKGYAKIQKMMDDKKEGKTTSKKELKEQAQNAQNSEEAKEVSFTLESVKTFVRKISKIPLLPARNQTILARSSFIMLNNYFEYLFSDLLTFYFKHHDGILNNRVSIPIQDLKKYSSIDEAYEDLLYKEVESILLEMNFEELKKFFKEKLKVDLADRHINWTDINEIRERRHIIIHNNSIINQKYISRSGNPYHLDLGKPVDIDSIYFSHALNTISTAGTILLFNCWGKWEKDTTADAIGKMLDLSYELLLEKKYEQCINLCDYCSGIKARNDGDGETLLRIKFNQCIALKKTSQLEKIDKILGGYNIGTLTPIYKIAFYAIKGQNENVIEQLKNAVVVDELKKEHYDEWPLFEDIRNDPALNTEALKILVVK